MLPNPIKCDIRQKHHETKNALELQGPGPDANRFLMSAKRPFLSAKRPLLSASRPLLCANRPSMSLNRPFIRIDER